MFMDGRTDRRRTDARLIAISPEPFGRGIKTYMHRKSMLRYNHCYYNQYNQSNWEPVFTRTERVRLKVVICGKYINLNKITKTLHISLKFNRLLIFVILYSLQNRGACCLKKCFNRERSKGIFVRENLKK